jgi:DNA-binding winged helix-turn-helix (wHTH) protein/TolB-like protein
MTAEHRFGPFRFVVAERVLYRDGQPVALMPKAIDTLAVLLERGGQVVEKAELMKLVWPDCVVEEIGLARNISLLRKALGDEGETYIETVPKRGYRFRAAEAETGYRPRRRWVAAGVVVVLLAGAWVYEQFYRPSPYLPARGRPIVAVTTFECLSPELERAAFGRGLMEALAAELGKGAMVQVISPGTVRRYERLAIPAPIMTRLLWLDGVVEGTAQQFGSQVRVMVRLSDVHSGRLIWSDTYEQPAVYLGTAQVVFAQAAAEEVRQRLRH